MSDFSWVTMRHDAPQERYCFRHGRYLDQNGLCPTCRREANDAMIERARIEKNRQTAVAEEYLARAEMWGL